MAQVYNLVASTSVVLVPGAGTSNRVVLLSSFQVPGRILGIRDFTGTASAANPIVVSTTEGVSFYDNTFSTLITEPFGSVIVSSKTPTTWQLLNTQAFFTTLSNAYLNSLTAINAQIALVSTVQEFLSTSITEKITVTNSITLGGSTDILGDITVQGTVDFFSSFQVNQTLSLSSLLTVGGNFVTLSSLQILGALQVGRTLSTLNSLFVQDSLTVEKGITAEAALVARTLSIPTLRMTTLAVGGGLRSALDLSTQSALQIGQDLTALGSTMLQSTVMIQGGLSIKDSLDIGSTFTTGTLSSGGFVSLTGPLSVVGPTRVDQGVSSFSDIIVGRQFTTETEAVIQGDLFVGGLSRIQHLTVLGATTISTVQAFSTVQVQGDVLSYGSTITVSRSLDVTGPTGIAGSLRADQASGVALALSTGGSLGVGGALTIGSTLTVQAPMTVQGKISGPSSLSLQGTLSTGHLSLNERFLVQGNFSVRGFLGASTLGAPIDLSASTMTLSNTLYVTSWGSVPLFSTTAYPDSLIVGNPSVDQGYSLQVEGILKNQSSVIQGDALVYPWYARQLETSTLRSDVVLSTSILGPRIEFTPFLTNRGAILTGDFSGAENLFWSSNVSSFYVPTTSNFPGPAGGKAVAYNGSQWVAVGDPSSSLTPAESILASLDGYAWLPAATLGFELGGLGVAYGGDKWVAVGCNTAGNATIQYSSDGRNWVAAANDFPSASLGFGVAVAYNGSNLWVAAGSNPSMTGLKYSGTGINWSDAVLIPPIPFSGQAVGFGGGRWLASDGTAQIVTSTDGINWALSLPLGKTSFVYNGTYWVAGGAAVDDDPLTSIHVSLDGASWIQILSGGFSGGCQTVVWDSNASVWYAVGSTKPLTAQILQTSVDGFFWTPLTTEISGAAVGTGMALGSVQGPDQAPYFTVTLETRMNTLLSSLTMRVSTVQVSSIESGGFFGNGIGISNVTSFRETVFTSSFLADSGSALDLSAQRFTTQFLNVADTVTVQQNSFLSSINLWVAGGADSEPNGYLQTSFTGSNWFRGTGPTFEFYAKGVAGNSNSASPFFVAVGGDTRTDYTIQWSLDARTWYPSLSGAFTIPDDGVIQGNSIVYSPTASVWVAAGNAKGASTTLLYSYDGKNWIPGSNAFADRATFVAASPSGLIALGDTGIKYSSDGIFWQDSFTPLTLDTVGYGQVQIGVLTLTGWLGTSNTDVYASETGGLAWLPIGTSLRKMTSVIYSVDRGLWVGVGCNQIQYSSNGASWTNVTTSFSPDTLFNAVAYNSNLVQWVAGAVSTTADKSLWTSTDLQNWLPAQSGGFSTTVEGSAAGYGIFTSSLYTYAGGQGSFNGVTGLRQQILSVSTNGAGSYLTSNSLTQSNASNVFLSQVRGIYGSVGQPYTYIAVGDGEVPQKTIARSLNAAADSWIPAITGGFSTTGYGVTDYKGLWLAVGDAQVSTNTIQYSLDGANWFGTNTAAAVRTGGRGIGAGLGPLSNTVVAVGKDPAKSTIVVSQTGYTWTPGTGSYFQGEGRGVAGGSNGASANFVAVGIDTRGSASTILQSVDGLTWTNVNAGGFSGGGYGVAFGLGNTYVAVGEDPVQTKTIQYSVDGGTSFLDINTGGFTKAGYAVGYNHDSNLFFAVGEDIGGERYATIQYSGDGYNWSNVSTIAGFQSQITLGAAYSVFTQNILVTEIIPYVELKHLVIYERTEPLAYPNPTIRLQSSFMTLNESLLVNLSTQLVINSNAPYDNAVLTVNGDLYASSFLYVGSTIFSDRLYVSSLIVSTLSSVNYVDGKFLETPDLAWNTYDTKANLISSFLGNTYSYTLQSELCNILMLGINQTLFTTALIPVVQQIGIGTSNPLYELDISGSFGVSSLSTGYLFSPLQIQAANSNGVLLQDPFFALTSSRDTALPFSASNRMDVTPSSLTFNSILSLNLSTQQVGVYTQTPKFSLDVRSHTLLQSLSSPQIQTSLFFLTVQNA